jgi:hypothetical protein
MKNTKKLRKTNRKTKKNKRYRSSNKRGGNGYNQQFPQVQFPQVQHQQEEMSDLEKQSLQKLQELKDERKAQGEKAMEEASTIAKGVTANALEGIGETIGVDVSNPEEVSEKLDDIKEALSNPETIEKTKEVINEAAKTGAIYLEAADPVLKPLTKKALDIGSDVVEKTASTAITIGANFVKEIPGVGLAYSLIQDASKLGEAASAVTNATAELTTDIADSAVVFKDNLEQKLKEGQEIQNRTNNSIEQFQQPLYPNQMMAQPNQMMLQPNQMMPLQGGARFSKKNKKTKKTRRYTKK